MSASLTGIVQSKGKQYDHPQYAITRLEQVIGIGGAAITAYAGRRLWHETAIKKVFFYVTVADNASSQYQLYYRAAADAAGTYDQTVGPAVVVGNAAAGSMFTLDLSSLVTQTNPTDQQTVSVSGTSTVYADLNGYLLAYTGDYIYLKSGGSNGASGRVDICYEEQWDFNAAFN